MRSTIYVCVVCVVSLAVSKYVSRQKLTQLIYDVLYISSTSTHSKTHTHTFDYLFLYILDDDDDAAAAATD